MTSVQLCLKLISHAHVCHVLRSRLTTKKKTDSMLFRKSICCKPVCATPVLVLVAVGDQSHDRTDCVTPINAKSKIVIYTWMDSVCVTNTWMCIGKKNAKDYHPSVARMLNCASGWVCDYLVFDCYVQCSTLVSVVLCSTLYTLVRLFTSWFDPLHLGSTLYILVRLFAFGSCAWVRLLRLCVRLYLISVFFQISFTSLRPPHCVSN